MIFSQNVKNFVDKRKSYNLYPRERRLRQYYYRLYTTEQRWYKHLDEYLKTAWINTYKVITILQRC